MVLGAECSVPPLKPQHTRLGKLLTSGGVRTLVTLQSTRTLPAFGLLASAIFCWPD